MELAELIATAQDVGSACDVIFSGLDAIYLVPVGDGFSTLFHPELFTGLPTIDKIPQRIELEMESSEFRCAPKVSAAGRFWGNTLSMNSVRNVSDWVFSNRESRFWLILRSENRWIISGDDAQPYQLVSEYRSGKTIQEGQAWDIQLSGDQLRPYFIYEEPEGGGGEDPDPDPDPE